MNDGTFVIITPEQRNALLSNGMQRCDAAFQSIRDTYELEGVVLVRGLLDNELLDRVCSAGDALTKGASSKRSGSECRALFTPSDTLDFGAIFKNFEEDGNGVAFREIALEGAIPAFVANVLLGIGEKGGDNTTLRLLKDAFMAKGKEGSYCGWHVDDIGFWPTDKSSAGVNSWVALDDMPAKYGGGLAVSPRSHTADWKEKAYEAIGSTPLLPPDVVSADMLGFQTCQMQRLDPNVNEQIESTKEIFDYKRGDILFCHRWLFHRSVALTDEGMKHYEDDLALKRYTIRYERGNAKLLKGISLESSTLLHSENLGRTLDEVCNLHGPFYPRYFTDKSDVESQNADMKALVADAFPAAREKRDEMMKALSGMMKKKDASAQGTYHKL